MFGTNGRAQRCAALVTLDLSERVERGRSSSAGGLMDVFMKRLSALDGNPERAGRSMGRR